MSSCIFCTVRGGCICGSSTTRCRTSPPWRRRRRRLPLFVTNTTTQLVLEKRKGQCLAVLQVAFTQQLPHFPRRVLLQNRLQATLHSPTIQYTSIALLYSFLSANTFPYKYPASACVFFSSWHRFSTLSACLAAVGMARYTFARSRLA